MSFRQSRKILIHTISRRGRGKFKRSIGNMSNMLCCIGCMRIMNIVGNAMSILSTVSYQLCKVNMMDKKYSINKVCHYMRLPVFLPKNSLSHK